MLIIRKRGHARAGLLGNPSDGYHGKTISIILRNFWADVVLYEWDSVDIVLAEQDRARFRSIYDLAKDVELHGYYGGIRLIKATIKSFVDYCQAQGIVLHDQNFSVRYQTTIPQQVGLAGSSAIITATLHALMEFYGVDMPLPVRPTFVLAVEGALGIAGGLQDRVIQCYEGMVYMDFARENAKTVTGLTHYDYECMDPTLLPPIYVAYHATMGEPTEVFHNDIRGRYNRGDPQIVEAMQGQATRHGCWPNDMGLYIQPINYGAAAHLEFNFYYDAANAEEVSSVERLFAGAIAEALRLEAHFTRPYGKLVSDLVYEKAAGYTALLKKAKHVLDPNHIMNPGTLCF